MKTEELIAKRIEELRVALRMSKNTRAFDTERTYTGIIARFLRFYVALPDFRGVPAEEAARRYVLEHAGRWSVATQHQFRCAIVFYYKHVANAPLGDLGEWAQARRPKRLPVWLADSDMKALLCHMRGMPRLLAKLDYGCGARSQEIVRLRVRDVDFANRAITVRGGKGQKDRVTLLPDSVADELREHMACMRALWEADRRNGRPGVEVVSSKFNGEDWHQLWLFAADRESRCPRTGIIRRHHVHKSMLGKAVAKAVLRWGGNQRVTVHSLRHSFATSLLVCGTPIQDVQALLGHTHIATTQIYAHCLPRVNLRIRSPMDEPAPANITPVNFSQREPAPIFQTA